MDGRVWLVDPFEAEGLEERVRELGEPAGVIQLLDRHGRDCAALAWKLGVPHHVVPRALPETPFTFLPVLVVAALAGGRALVARAADPRLRGRAGDDPVLSRRGGADRRASVPTTLPAPGAARVSAQQHVLVGHGEGRHGPDAAAEVDDALAHARRRIPRWLAGLRRATGDQT